MHHSAKKTNTILWEEANQQHLMAELNEVRHALEHHTKRSGDTSNSMENPLSQESTIKEPTVFNDSLPALDTICSFFHLSTFERRILLLCAGMELDASFASLCSAANEDPAKPYPTFSLALQIFPEAHWSALSPESPLRHWRLIDMGSGNSITRNPIRIDERILHFLTGVNYQDERLQGFIEPILPCEDLAPSHLRIKERMINILSGNPDAQPLPVIHLQGAERKSQQAIAQAALSDLGLQLYALVSQVIPDDPRELEAMARLWQREALLSGSGLLVECSEHDKIDKTKQRALNRLIEMIHTQVIISGPDFWSLFHRPLITLPVEKPAPHEQKQLWQNKIGSMIPDPDDGPDELIAQFNLSTQAIHTVCSEATEYLKRSQKSENGNQTDILSVLWDICCTQSRPWLEDLAQYIKPVAAWEDIILPEIQMQTLREIAVHVRQRATVYDTWNFKAKNSRGLGISALFAGVSGTGKTMAAEVLANELKLNLYRIDLSQVVNKYIGETEKNLKRVFDAAEDSGAILLFDEADALFGKRSDVKDSHDRYANIEVSYLLQRMEEYRGLAILTTNLQHLLDTAFMRRIRFVVQFPFPDAAQRVGIWKQMFPEETPVQELDMDKLSRLNVAGGNIRNIALHAAFLAADDGKVVRMSHLSQAARSEFSKPEKSLTEAEIGDWS